MLHREASSFLGKILVRNFIFQEIFNSSIDGGNDTPADVIEISILEILNGLPDGFPGFVAIVQNYLENINCDEASMLLISKYCERL
jgi:hypothetical protein